MALEFPHAQVSPLRFGVEIDLRVSVKDRRRGFGTDDLEVCKNDATLLL